MKIKFYTLMLVIFITSCASKELVTGKDAAEQKVIAANESEAEPAQFRVKEEGTVDTTKVEELEIIPTELNANVDKWIAYFQGRGRPHMEKYLLRSTRYEPLMKKVLRDNKLPEDLFYIALIESGFSSQAFSHASAVGYWQFIRGTGKRYKLKINQLIDERRDPVLSTQAAAEYFKDLYGIFNSWYLAMASYNVGEGRVIKATRKYKTQDFWALTKIRRALPRETDDYIPKFIAAKLIAKNPDKYGFEGVDYMPPIEFDHVSVDQPVNLRLMAEKLNINYEDFKALNPKYKGEVAPLDNDNTLGLRIPPGSYEAAIIAAKESFTDKVEYVADRDEIQTYKIKRNENFSTIARKFRTTVAYLRDINDFPRKKKLRAGQKIFVPDRTPLEKTRPDLVAKRVYIVQPGDSLASIADKYKVKVSELKKANRLSRRSKIRSGVKLVLPDNATFDDVKETKNSSSQQKKSKVKKYASSKKKRSVARE